MKISTTSLLGNKWFGSDFLCWKFPFGDVLLRSDFNFGKVCGSDLGWAPWKGLCVDCSWAPSSSFEVRSGGLLVVGAAAVLVFINGCGGICLCGCWEGSDLVGVDCGRDGLWFASWDVVLVSWTYLVLVICWLILVSSRTNSTSIICR